MKVVPQFQEAGMAFKSFFSSIGTVGTIVIIVIALVAVFLLWDSASNKLHAWMADRQIEQLKQESNDAKAQAAQAEAEKEQFKGAAAVYKQQADAQQQQVTELLNVRPELQKQSTAAARRVEEIRNRPVRPIDDAIRQRVDDLSASLDQLYPD